VRAALRNHLQQACRNGPEASLAATTILKTLTPLEENLRAMMPAELARWGYVYGNYTMTDWERNIAYIRNELVPVRTEVVFRQFSAWLDDLDAKCAALKKL
jgi:hypothetical protein